MRSVHVLILLLVMHLFATETVAAYRFLGRVERVFPGASGVSVECSGRRRLSVQFVAPATVRVTLGWPEREDPPLEYALVRNEWENVPLKLSETETAVVARSAAMEVVIERYPCRLVIRDLEGRVICEDEPGLGHGWEFPEVRCWKHITPDERFFGLGLKGGNVNKRGGEWVMWNSDIPAYTDRTDPLYQSVPFFVGMREGRAYGIYLNNSYRTRFNFGAGNQRYYSFAAEDGMLDYFFVYGPEIPEVVKGYTELTGRTPLPPLWSLGYQQCRWSYYPESEVVRIASTFREKQIPADVIYLDIHYMDGYRVFTWDGQRFPNPSGMLEGLEQQGFKVVTIIDPGVKVDSLYPVAREGLDEGHFVHYPDGQVYVGEVWPGPSYFPDFSRGETRDWWAGHVNQMRETGVDGFWNDMNEPAVWGQAFPLETMFYDGGRETNHKKMHNLYGFLMAQGTYEGLRQRKPDERPFVLTRAGFAGEQRYAAVWTGDNVASWEHLELGIRMMLGLGMSGVPFVGTDIGGFIGTPSPELYARWIQVGALSPLSRTHTHHNSADQEPWSFGEQVEDISRKYITLRYRLLPYLYSLFHESSRNGAPLLRPLFWHDQEDERTYEWDWQHQFFVGERLLVAPVTREGQTLKKLYLPQGRWLDMNTEAVYQGPAEITVDAPLDRLPAFLREGAIMPLRDSVQFTGERPIQELTLEVFAGPDSAGFDLYEDDGQSFAYENGSYRLTRYGCRRDSSAIIVARALVHNEYQPGERELVFRVHDIAAAPQRVTVNGGELRGKDFTFDARTRILTIRVPERGDAQRVIIS